MLGGGGGEEERREGGRGKVSDTRFPPNAPASSVSGRKQSEFRRTTLGRPSTSPRCRENGARRGGAAHSRYLRGGIGRRRRWPLSRRPGPRAASGRTTRAAADVLDCPQDGLASPPRGKGGGYLPPGPTSPRAPLRPRGPWFPRGPTGPRRPIRSRSRFSWSWENASSAPSAATPRLRTPRRAARRSVNVRMGRPLNKVRGKNLEPTR